MTSIRDMAVLEQSLLKTVSSVLGVPASSLYTMNEAHECVQVIHQYQEVVTDHSSVERLVEQQETIYNQIEIPKDVAALMENARLTHRPSHWRTGESVLTAYPLIHDGVLSGHLVFRTDYPLPATSNAVISGMLQVYSNYHTLLDESQRDRLTGLYNRHALELSLERMWPMLTQPHVASTVVDSRRQSPPARPQFWLAIIDVDHFKDVNDNHGHVVGDEILLLISRLLLEGFRKSDLIYRYGGEEFIAITSSLSDETAHETFDRIRQHIDRHQFPRVGRVTVSLGYAIIDPMFSSHEIISRADRALYQAKRDGRNRIYSHEALIAAGVLPGVNYGSVDLF